MSAPKLRRCPRCPKGRPLIEGGELSGYWPVCSTCGLSDGIGHESIAAAIAAWNRRPDVERVLGWLREMGVDSPRGRTPVNAAATVLADYLQRRWDEEVS